MTRPTYERPADLDAEREMIAAAFPRVVAHKLPISYRVDYLLEFWGTQGVRRAWCECKARNVVAGTYADYMLSLGKFAAGCELARATGYPLILLIRWTDCLMRFTLDTSSPVAYPIDMGGRKDRDDAQDVEPVVMIPLREFSMVATLPQEKQP